MPLAVRLPVELLELGWGLAVELALEVLLELASAVMPQPGVGREG